MLAQRTPLRDASNVPATNKGLKRNPFAQGGNPQKKQKLTPAREHGPPPPAPVVEPTPRDLSTRAYRDCIAHGASIRALRLPGSRPRPAPPSSVQSLECFVSSKTTDSYPAATLHSRALSLAYSNEAKRGGTPMLAAGGVDGHICLWQAGTRLAHECLPQQSTYKVHNNMIRDLRWSSDDQFLASASADKYATVTNVATGIVIHDIKHAANVHVVAWDPNHDSLLMTVAKNHQVRIWDLRDPATPKVVISPEMPSASVNITSAIYLPYEPHRIVTSWSQDGILKKWDMRHHHASTETLAISRPCEESSLDPTLARSGATRARGISNLLYSARTASVLGLAVNGRIHSYAPFLPAQENHAPVAFGGGAAKSSFFVRMAESPCGRWVACGSTCGTAHVYDVAGGAAAGVVLERHRDEVHGLDWASDGLAFASDDTAVSIWRHDPEVAMGCRDDPEAMAWKWHWARREE